VAEPLSPDWWLNRLFADLLTRRDFIDLADQWYSGPQPVPYGYDKASDLLKQFHDEANANFSALLVDSCVERLHVEGFKVDGQINDDAWEIWQSNGFDLGSEQVFLDRLALGEAAILVDPERNADGLPTITPEHPSQTIVEYRPGRMRERAAGLKVWIDDLLDEPALMATVYLPDAVVTYAAPAGSNFHRNGTIRTGEPVMVPAPAWELQPSKSGRHDLGEVPLVAFPNRPRMMSSGLTEFDRTLPIQKRINRTILDRLTNQHFGAFKQKWATGIEVPLDPVTGNPVEPFNSAIDRAFIAEDPAARFGQFQPEDISSLLAAVSDDVKQMAALVPTPPHYLLGDLVNLSAEALKAAEAALVSRVRMHMRHIGEPLEAVMRLALKAGGKASPSYAAMETRWRNPEFRTEGELVDALTKMKTLGVPNEALWERWGATPDEIKDWKAQQASEAQRVSPLGGLDGLLNPGQPQPPQQPQVPGGNSSAPAS
jgi:hypothetical protein